ncbi:YfcC family protein [Gaopeijia maritima]|uniref:YfcC family protein n=1 Tax=Gaopeijia maritima TaxID=3119007 RepID=A0ABU9E9N7_9BACT
MSTSDTPKAIDTTLIVFLMIVAAAALTWVVPPGSFDTVALEVPGAGTRDVVVPGSYERLDARSPQGIGAVLRAPIRGLVEAADVVGFVLLVGGAFAVLQATGAVERALRSLVRAAERSPLLEAAIIPTFMALFSLGGAVFGMAEETIPFVLIFVPLARSLGYDAIVGVAIPFVGSQAGFAAAFLNPFTVGVAQGIAEVPLFSGIGLRIVLWGVTTAIAIAFVVRYARRIRTAPDPGAARTPPDAAPVGPANRTGPVLLTFTAGIGLLVYGVLRHGWYIEEIAALFVGVGIAVGVVGRLGPGRIAREFMEGARDLVATAVIIGLARGILVVLEDGMIVDTLLQAMAGVLDGVGSVGAAQGMFAVQTVLNFFVPSGSGQAALTMPLMAPLADLTGLTRQVAVLAFQMGDGFTNLIIPTNPVLMGAISLAGVSWTRWARWMVPLQLILFALGLAALAIAVTGGF